MTAKEVLFSSDARKRMLRGLNTLADAVKEGHTRPKGPQCGV